MPDRAVDRAGGARLERDHSFLAALARDGQRAASRTGPRPSRLGRPARETCTSPAGGRDDDLAHRFGQGQAVLPGGHRRGKSVALVLIRPRRHAS
jgi:hypothetical protein